MTKEALKMALEALESCDAAHITDGGRQWYDEKLVDKAITAIKEALANEALEKMAENARELGLDYEPEQTEHGWTPERIAGMARLKEAQDKKMAQPEFIKHEVKNSNDWSEWVCPDPKNYLMKCCDCGLVHEAEFGVVRYKSETEREDCDMVDDPNLQAVFRMRRSEEWTPEDTAHRSGGLPMAEQEPVAWAKFSAKGNIIDLLSEPDDDYAPLYTTPPQRKPLSDEEIEKIAKPFWDGHLGYGYADFDSAGFARAIEAAHGIKEKNT